MSEKLLDVQNLKTQFKGKNGTVTALDGISFSVHRGETLGIVGESGCGKSVTALSILQLIPERTGSIPAGEILFKGDNLLDKTKKEMCNIRGNEIAMIFQDSMTALNPVLTIGKQLMEPFIAHKSMNKKEAWAASVSMLEKVGIPAAGARMSGYPHQFSGGMRQRVMIAMALCCDASLLIADEPTTALDVTIQAQILELMRELKEDLNTSIMLITHDMGVIAEMADNVLVMYAGKIVEYSDVNSIFTDPLHPYTKGLLASIPRLDQGDEKLFTIEGAVPDLSNMPKGCRFAARCEDAKELCSAEEPEMFQVGNRHVYCWKYQPERG